MKKQKEMRSVDNPKKHTSGLYRFCSSKQKKQIYTSNLEEFNALRAAERDKQFKEGVSKRIVKRNSAKYKELPIGLTKSLGQTKGGVKRFITDRGNPNGRIAGFINGEMVSVSFGDVRTEEEAITSVCAYVEAGVAPPRAYFDLASSQLVYFDDEAKYQTYKLESERIPPLIRVILGVTKNGQTQYTTKTGELMGLFRISVNGRSVRFNFGKLKSQREAAEKLIEYLKTNNYPLGAYMFNGECIEFSPYSESEAKSAIINLVNLTLVPTSTSKM